MALSAKERKQRQLERERQELVKIQDATYPYLATPFYEHLEQNGNWSSVELCFDLLGINPPSFNDDRGPEAYANDICFSSDEEKAETFQSSEKSIGRAEVMVDMLIGAAMEMASIINNFKADELQKQRLELENHDLSTPESRKDALEKAAEIAKLQDELRKNVRYTFPRWRVKLKS